MLVEYWDSFMAGWGGIWIGHFPVVFLVIVVLVEVRCRQGLAMRPIGFLRTVSQWTWASRHHVLVDLRLKLDELYHRAAVQPVLLFAWKTATFLLLALPEACPTCRRSLWDRLVRPLC